MATVEVRDLRNAKVGEIELDELVFGEKRKTHIVYEEVKRYLASRRAGTHATKTRGMVSGGGKKPWKQKGTGRARAGSNRSPLWRHGGTTHGPQPRSYDLKLNRKARKLAMRVVLSDKLRQNELLVVDAIALSEAKTKRVAEMVRALELEGRSLIVEFAANGDLRLAARNHQDVTVLSPSAVSAYDVLQHRRLVVTRESVERLQEIFRP